jgi:hypothetical protein
MGYFLLCIAYEQVLLVSGMSSILSTHVIHAQNSQKWDCPEREAILLPVSPEVSV